MGRRELREQIFKMLFRAEFHEEEELPEQLILFFDELDKKELDINEIDDNEKNIVEEKDADYIKEKFKQIIDHMTEIDLLINEAAKGWKTSRMGKVDLALIRLAVYEMKFEEDIPVGVAINEAVELAKNYGTDDSASFVNGILAKMV